MGGPGFFKDKKFFNAWLVLEKGSAGTEELYAGAYGVPMPTKVNPKRSKAQKKTSDLLTVLYDHKVLKWIGENKQCNIREYAIDWEGVAKCFITHIKITCHTCNLYLYNLSGKIPVVGRENENSGTQQKRLIRFIQKIFKWKIRTSEINNFYELFECCLVEAALEIQRARMISPPDFEGITELKLSAKGKYLDSALIPIFWDIFLDQTIEAHRKVKHFV
ncbi:MAG: hypothetical protein NTY48_04405 [Candidatus Diapherotrites archaeon]|nr:hypothetical protein [Candidatus Diapherotrites archaeon]